MYASVNQLVGSQAVTLNPEEVCENHNKQIGKFTRKHLDGWTITGEIQEDYYYFVVNFEAVHREYGRVKGSFEDTIFFDTYAGYIDFYEKHTPDYWDYADI